jgi:hypothetical protein
MMRPNGKTRFAQASSPRWACVNAEALRWGDWEPETVTFNGETGETHLLSTLPAYVLQLLQERQRATEEICLDAADACATANDDAWHRKILAILRNLEDLELIERHTLSRV